MSDEPGEELADVDGDEDEAAEDVPGDREEELCVRARITTVQPLRTRSMVNLASSSRMSSIVGR